MGNWEGVWFQQACVMCPTPKIPSSRGVTGADIVCGEDCMWHSVVSRCDVGEKQWIFSVVLCCVFIALCSQCCCTANAALLSSPLVWKQGGIWRSLWAALYKHSFVTEGLTRNGGWVGWSMGCGDLSYQRNTSFYQYAVIMLGLKYYIVLKKSGSELWVTDAEWTYCGFQIRPSFQNW